jgi:hypothetical protein
MHMHKPKVVHDWREFVTEIGVIVCGIVIALGLEQAVDWTRWRHEVQEARRAMGEELGYNASVLRLVVDQDACVQKRLDLLTAWAEGRGRIDSSKLVVPVNLPLLPSLRSSAWEVAKSAEVAAHIPLQERVTYAAMYDDILNQETVIRDARDAWRALSRYAGKSSLDPADARRLVEDVAAERGLENRLKSNALISRATLESLGVKSDRVYTVPGRSVVDMCRPLD